MDTNVTILLIVVILAVVAIVALLRFGQKGRAKITGPGGMGVDVSGSNRLPIGVEIIDSESRAGGALAEDSTGHGAAIKRTKVEEDLIASSSPPPSDNPPKAQPP